MASGIIWFLAAGLLFGSCGVKPQISDLDIDNSNALRVSLKFSLTDTEHPVLWYWNTEQPDVVHQKPLPPAPQQDLVLFRLKPSSEYAFLVTSGQEPELYSSDTIRFETPRLPYTLPRLTITTDSGLVFDGYIMLRKVEDPSQQLLIDNQGEIIWYHQFDTIVSRFYSWTPEETILSLHDEDEIVEFDLSGHVLNSLHYGQDGFDQLLHHEIIQDAKGQIISLTRNMQTFDLTEFGGLEQDTIYGDGILVLDRQGQKIWEWDMYRIEDPLKDENINAMKKDWSHGNSLEIDRDGHYLISFRNFHQVWKIHSETGDVLWKLGMNGDFDLSGEEIFYSQHTAYVNRFGEIMIFDNGGPERPVSRVISFNVDSKGIYEPGRINVGLPRELYTFKEGSAYLMGDDKILFCSTRANTLVITNLNGDILWQLRTSESFYRAYYIAEIRAFE
jgi:hypothetical protein